MSDNAQLFTPSYLDETFPVSKTDAFFEALFGDAEDGAYTIQLRFESQTASELRFAFHLVQRQGMCLSCNLTYGLPQVFSRHPVLGVGQLAQTLCERVGVHLVSWTLGSTREISRTLHIIPFIITIS